MAKMIVMDLDGTLLDDDENVSPYTLSIMKKCKKVGMKIVIATARGRSAEKAIDLVEPDFSILDDGTLILDSNKKIINTELLALGMSNAMQYGHIETRELLINSYSLWSFDKMTAVEILAKSQGIPLSEIIAFGDDHNDIEMIKNCGVGIAMENAIHTVKHFSKGICMNNNEDGVARWIEENILK